MLGAPEALHPPFLHVSFLGRRVRKALPGRQRVRTADPSSPGDAPSVQSRRSVSDWPAGVSTDATTANSAVIVVSSVLSKAIGPSSYSLLLA